MTREQSAALARARRFVAGLDAAALGDLGDALVTGLYDWRDWFASPVARIPAWALDRARIEAEQTR